MFKVGDRVIRKGGTNTAIGTIERVASNNRYYVRWEHAAASHGTISSLISGSAIVLATSEAVEARYGMARARQAAYQAERLQRGDHCKRCGQWQAWEYQYADGTCRGCQNKPICEGCHHVYPLEQLHGGVCSFCARALAEEAADVDATDRAFWQADYVLGARRDARHGWAT